MPPDRAILLLAGVAGLALAGCSQRTLVVTSEPPGARVIVNDQDLGTTPLSADFTFYGTYDVRVEKDGFEPLRTSAPARAPLHEYPPIDLALLPLPIRNSVRWHFTLSPMLERQLPERELDARLLDRARAMRHATNPAEPVP